MLAFRLLNRVDKNISAQMLLLYYEPDQLLYIVLVEGSINGIYRTPVNRISQNYKDSHCSIGGGGAGC